MKWYCGMIEMEQKFLLGDALVFSMILLEGIIATISKTIEMNPSDEELINRLTILRKGFQEKLDGINKGLEIE